MKMMKKTKNGEEQFAVQVAAVQVVVVFVLNILFCTSYFILSFVPAVVDVCFILSGDVMNYWHFMYPMSLFSFGPLFDKKFDRVSPIFGLCLSHVAINTTTTIAITSQATFIAKDIIIVMET